MLWLWYQRFTLEVWVFGMNFSLDRQCLHTSKKGLSSVLIVEVPIRVLIYGLSADLKKRA